jgi:hypothetical protein
VSKRLCKESRNVKRRKSIGRKEFLYEKSFGSELSRSLRRKECVGSEVLTRPSSRGTALVISVNEVEDFDSSEEQRFETFEHLGVF